METDRYVFFFGHKPNKLNTHYFSQWYQSTFVNSKGIEFNCCEQFMMYKKAILFRDYEIAEKILAERDPKKIKAMGRAVKNYTEEKWNKYKYRIVVRANKLKFSQNKTLLDRLIQTGNKTIVEASPYDKIWGIGLNASVAVKTVESKWPGQNLLGLALMEVRQTLANKN